MFDAIKKYAVFSGRATRKEYWLFILLFFIGYIVAAIVDTATGNDDPITGMGPVSGLFTLALVIPSLAVLFRRLHDTDRSAWWILISLIPLVGAIVLLVFVCLDGTPGGNRFGPNPKEVDAVLPDE